MPPRKRSHWIWLGLVGAGTGMLLLNTRTSQPDDSISGNLFTGANDCTASGHYSIDTCKTAYADAARQHEQTAPRYRSLADCEAEFSRGGCTGVPPANGAAAPATNSVFIPVMVGMVLGGGFANLIAPSAAPVYRPCSSDPGREDCRSASGSGGGIYYTSTGYRIMSRGGSSASVPRGAFSGSPSAVTLSRGSFGARAMAISARA